MRLVLNTCRWHELFVSQKILLLKLLLLVWRQRRCSLLNADNNFINIKVQLLLALPFMINCLLVCMEADAATKITRNNYVVLFSNNYYVYYYRTDCADGTSECALTNVRWSFSSLSFSPSVFCCVALHCFVVLVVSV